MKPSKNNFLKNTTPTLLLMLALSLAGGYLYFFTESNVFCPGYITMIIFYRLICFMRTYAANAKLAKNEDDVMLAERRITMWIGIFTMSASWVGGGYLNGAAEFTYDSDYGLTWVQAPWGYDLSLVFAGLLFARK